MSKLIYITNTSLDGYIEDQTGAFDWCNPDQVFDFITELMRPIGTHLLGRRLYETMAYWDAPVEGYSPEHRDFARVWQKAEQIVFSRTLTGAPTRIARVEREFDPEATRKLKRESEHDIFIGGAGNHTLDGGAGSDMLDYSSASSPVTVNFDAGSAVNGRGGIDNFASFEIFKGGAGADT